VARGKLALLDGIIEGMFKNPMGVQDRLMRCLLCGSCEAHCPSGVKTLDVFLKARAILTGVMGYSPLKRALFRGLLAYPGLFHRVFEWAASLQDFFLKPADDLLETFQGRALSPLVGERHVRKLASPPFYRTRKALRKPAGKSNLRVAFSWAVSSTRYSPRSQTQSSMHWIGTESKSISPGTSGAAAFQPCVPATPSLSPNWFVTTFEA